MRDILCCRISPVVQIIDPFDHVDVSALSGKYPDQHIKIVTRNVVEEWYEEGDDGETGYSFSKEWDSLYNAVLDEIRRKGGLHNLVAVM